MVAENLDFFKNHQIQGPVVFWFRRDLRVTDHPALNELARQKVDVCPIYLFSRDTRSPLCLGSAATWWVSNSLSKLNKAIGKTLSVHQIEEELPSLEGELRNQNQIAQALIGLCKKNRTNTVIATESLFSRLSIEKVTSLPAGVINKLTSRECLDDQIGSVLRANGIRFVLFPDSDLASPGDIQKPSGGPYQVFTPFYKRYLQETEDVSLEVNSSTESVRWKKLVGGSFQELEVDPQNLWAHKLAEHWVPGRETASECMDRFADHAVENYPEDRDFPGIEGTSRLSPYLAFGEVSAREVAWAITAGRPWKLVPDAHRSYLRQLVWRFFSRETLRAFPEMVGRDFQSKYERFPWKNDGDLLKRWQSGNTGFPIVDAAMRQLWETGWMHNRLRMVVGSFLVKNLQIHWSQGEAWFWDTLVDADLANNVFGWQWVAGCGMDAAPFFRIFNALTQSQKFDSDGSFIKSFLPELSGRTSKTVHLPNDQVEQGELFHGQEPDSTYPDPIVCLKSSRLDTLEKFKELKESS